MLREENESQMMRRRRYESGCKKAGRESGRPGGLCEIIRDECG